MNQDGRMFVSYESSTRRRKASRSPLTREDEVDMQLPLTRTRSNFPSNYNNPLVRPLHRNSFEVVFILGIIVLFMILLAAESDWVIHFNLDAGIVHSNRRSNNWHTIDGYQHDNIEAQPLLLHEKGRRVVFYSSPGMVQRSNRNVSSMIQIPHLEVTNQENATQSFEENECVPMREWQSESFPVCNQVHEMDMAKGHTTNSFSLLGSGWFRNTWKVDTIQDSFALKMLRFERDFSDEFYELHRRDAIAMERLTSSPFILDVYGFCGQTAINEYADFIDGFQNFKTFAKQLVNKNDKDVLAMKLRISAMIAIAVQHIHEIDGADVASMVHNDINPMNIVITKGGIPKLNDFNVAEFLQWNQAKNETCGFEGRFHEPWWRSPEEMEMPALAKSAKNKSGKVEKLLNEKVDVYALGNIIYYLLTGHSPRGQTKAFRAEEQRNLVRRGVLPELHPFYLESTEPSIVAMRSALEQCYEVDPKKRPAARQIADLLVNATRRITSSP